MVVQFLWAALFPSFILCIRITQYLGKKKKNQANEGNRKNIFVQLYALPEDYSIKLAYSEPSTVVPLPYFWYVKGKLINDLIRDKLTTLREIIQ